MKDAAEFPDIIITILTPLTVVLDSHAARPKPQNPHSSLSLPSKELWLQKSSALGDLALPEILLLPGVPQGARI